MSEDKEKGNVAIVISLISLLLAKASSGANAAMTATSGVVSSGIGFLTSTLGGAVIPRVWQNGIATSVNNPDGQSGNPSVDVQFGSIAGKAAQGNDVRFPPAPGSADQFLVDNGTSWVKRFILTSDIPSRLVDKLLAGAGSGFQFIEAGTASQKVRAYAFSNKLVFSYNGTVDASLNVTKDVDATQSQIWFISLGAGTIAQFGAYSNSNAAVHTWSLASSGTIAYFIDPPTTFVKTNTNFQQYANGGMQLKSAAAGDKLYVVFQWPFGWTPGAPAAGNLTFQNVSNLNVTNPTAPTIETNTANFLLVSFPVTANGDARWFGQVTGFNV